MLTVSREAPVKIGKHAWNVYPLEAFGYLLGTPDGQQISAALPCSKTTRWHDFSDRWNGLRSNLDLAKQIAEGFELEVIGLYCSTEQVSATTYPVPTLLNELPVGFLLSYHNLCCIQCSGFSIVHRGRKLVRGEDYVLSPGKRTDRALNQKRVHQRWIRSFGPIDYSNGYQNCNQVAEPIIPPDAG